MTPNNRLISVEELVASRLTHLLMLIPRGSIFGLRKHAKKLYRTPIFREGEQWWDNEKSAHEPGLAGWYLVRTEPSGANIWGAGQKNPPRHEKIPSTRVMVYTMVRYFLATGLRLAPNYYWRCAAFGAKGEKGKVGFFNREGIDIAPGSLRDCTCYGNVVQAFAKK